MSVAGGEMRGGAEDLVAVFKRADAEIRGERVLARFIRRVLHRVADPEDACAVFGSRLQNCRQGRG